MFLFAGKIDIKSLCQQEISLVVRCLSYRKRLGVAADISVSVPSRPTLKMRHEVQPSSGSNRRTMEKVQSRDHGHLGSEVPMIPWKGHQILPWARTMSWASCNHMQLMTSRHAAEEAAQADLWCPTPESW